MFTLKKKEVQYDEFKLKFIDINGAIIYLCYRNLLDVYGLILKGDLKRRRLYELLLNKKKSRSLYHFTRRIVLDFTIKQVEK